MNLLPRSLNDFRSRNYWDEFFRQRGLTNSFEWYGEYTDLCGILHKYSRSQHNVLVTGCGNSRLSEDLYDIGYHSITNIDISDVVIKQMTDRNEEKRPNLTFAKMDVLKMELPDASYDVVIDKGTLDSLCSDESEEVASNVTAMFNEIGRVLKAGGRYVCISLCQEHILKQIVDGFVSKGGWFVRVHKVEVVSGRNEDDHGLPVFAFVMTKAKPGLPVKVLEVSLDGSEQVIRVETAEQFQSEIRSVQQYAMFRQFMKKYHPGDEFQLTLWSSRDASVDNPRYTLNVVDSPTSPSQRGKYAAFIVPQGRENEWLFASPEGRAQLTLGAGFQRLAIASTHRGQTYESLQAVKDELSGSILELAPHDLPPNQRVLFLSVGEDVGQRTVVYRNRSELSGEFVVEDVAQDDNSISRRLIFLNKPTVIQSEVKLVMTVAMPEKGNTKKKGKKKQMKTVKDRRQIDISHLSCAHHKHVISGLAWVKSLANRSNHISLLVLGLGGGGMISFIDKHLPQVSVTVVEIDSAMLDVAKNWFGFTCSSRVKVIVEDGLKYLANSGQQFDAIVFDVDSKDKTLGISCPPPSFIEVGVLERVKASLKREGVFILNLVCRDLTFKQQAYQNITSIGFQTILSLPVAGEVNEVIVALMANPSSAFNMQPLKMSNGTSEEQQLSIPEWVVENVKCIDSMIKEGRGQLEREDGSSASGVGMRTEKAEGSVIDLSAPLEKLKLAGTVKKK